MKDSSQDPLSITIFGSGILAPDTSVYHDAEVIGQFLAQEGIVVCNGGYRGVMEASAKGCVLQGGHTIGVTVQSFDSPPNPYIKEERKTANLFERLQTLLNLGSGFIVFPGGTGTLVELALCWELNRKLLVYPAKPIILMGDFWSPVIKVTSTDPGFTEMMVQKEASQITQWISIATKPEEAVEMVLKAIKG